jgi:hypothetical protein
VNLLIIDHDQVGIEIFFFQLSILKAATLPQSFPGPKQKIIKRNIFSIIYSSPCLKKKEISVSKCLSA